MAKSQGPAQPSPKIQALLKDFQQIASMSGYLNHAFDPPQLRLFFTLYGRVMVASPEQGLSLTPQLQAWCDAVSNRLREGSSGTIMAPQVQVSAPQTMPDGRDYLVTDDRRDLLPLKVIRVSGYRPVQVVTPRGFLRLLER